MVAGHSQIKNGKAYAVLTYNNARGKRVQKWIPLGLTEKGNRKKIDEMVYEVRRSFVIPKEDLSAAEMDRDMPFTDYMLCWLDIAENTVAKTTFSSYKTIVEKKINKYFKDFNLKLSDIEAKHIQAFYAHELKTVKPKTVINEHNVLHRAMKYAAKMDIIPYNPVDKVDRPKKENYIADYYRADELEAFFEATKDSPYSLMYQVAAFYGLRRGEVLGLRWSAIDFNENTLTINHVAIMTNVNGKRCVTFEDRAKTKSSLRTLPLTEEFKEKLAAHKKQQEKNKEICGKSYDYTYDGYVFVNPLGKIFNPDTVSSQFKKVLKSLGLKEIRFHDLRHSCASLMVARGVPMKQIQDWLGHSDISTTSNIYSHLDYKSKVDSAGVMENALTLPKDGKEIGFGKAQNE